MIYGFIENNKKIFRNFETNSEILLKCRRRSLTSINELDKDPFVFVVS